MRPTRALPLAWLLAFAAAGAHAQTLQQLDAFNCTSTSCPDGKEPDALILASNGNLYGTAEYGGANTNGGTIFKLTPSGQITVLYTFPLNTTTGF